MKIILNWMFLYYLLISIQIKLEGKFKVNNNIKKIIFNSKTHPHIFVSNLIREG